MKLQGLCSEQAYLSKAKQEGAQLTVLKAVPVLEIRYSQNANTFLMNFLYNLI